MNKVIAVIDLKSFYASCECACRHLDIFTTPLVCCDPYRSSSSVVMSATPYLKKKYGIPNVCRRRDLPEQSGREKPYKKPEAARRRPEQRNRK